MNKIRFDLYQDDCSMVNHTQHSIYLLWVYSLQPGVKEKHQPRVVLPFSLTWIRLNSYFLEEPQVRWPENCKWLAHVLDGMLGIPLCHSSACSMPIQKVYKSGGCIPAQLVHIQHIEHWGKRASGCCEETISSTWGKCVVLHAERGQQLHKCGPVLISDN